jgi:hypothetical protein
MSRTFRMILSLPTNAGSRAHADNARNIRERPFDSPGNIDSSVGHYLFARAAAGL